MLLIIGLNACSDSSTGPETDPGEAPEIPTFNSSLQADLSYFQNNPPNSESTDNYVTAQGIVTTNAGILGIGWGFFGFTEGLRSVAEPTKEDGKWVWIYTITIEGETVTYKLTAFPGDTFIEWDLYITSPEFNNYHFMGGNVASDGTSGSWKIYNIDTQSSDVIFSFDWSAESETNQTLTATYYDDQGGVIGTLTYERQDDIYEFRTNPIEFPGDTFTVHWNTTLMTGYYIDGEGVKYCWNAEYQNVPCE